MKIIEIFKSLQGEGLSQGLLTTFIRLAGCNLRCAWCDTPQSRGSGGVEMTVSEVIERVSDLHWNTACITGGEPLLQMEELLILLDELIQAGYFISIETNGTIDFRQAQRFASICMDVKCPSSGEESDLNLLNYIRESDSVKFVVADIADCIYAKEVIEGNDICGTVFISPVEGSSYREIADFVIDNNLAARLQIQLHKLIGVK